jgi:ppGpp synthetase/RelA/SpoT-type nucleotidyltranferase
MADESLELELRRLDEAARLLHPRIDDVLKRHSYVDRLAYSCTSRIKTIPRMATKIQANRIAEPEYMPAMLPDILGFRIVTFFQSGILEAFEFLLALAEHDPRVGQSPFLQNEVRRITLITSRPEEDPLSISRRVEEIAQGKGLPIERGARGTLYSSLHVVLCANVEMSTVDGGAILVPLQVEFQIRSVFEEAWGELSHLLSYERTRTAIDPKSWQLHLGVLKALIDGCIQYAELIKEQAGVDLREAEAEKERSRSAASPKKILADLPPLTPEIRREFETALELENRAQEIGDDPSAGPTFSDAARAFQKVSASLTRATSIPESFKDRAIFIAQTEGAFCRLYSNDENAITSALEQYGQIVAKYETDTLSRYRYGQALRRNKDYAKAVEVFKEAIDLVNGGKDKAVTTEHWVYSSAYRELGYVHWLTMEIDENSVSKRDHLRHAIENTRLALSLDQDDQERIRSINNYIYYAWEERNFDGEVSEFEISDDELRGKLKELLEKTGSEEFTVHSYQGFGLWSAFDTAGRALDYLKDRVGAEQAARKVIALLVEKVKTRVTIGPGKRPSTREIQSHLTTDEFDAYFFAATLVGGG